MPPRLRSRHFCHRNSRMAAIGINPIYQRQRIPNLVKRFGQKLLLFGKAERVDFRRMAIDRDRTKTRNIATSRKCFRDAAMSISKSVSKATKVAGMTPSALNSI